MNEVVNRDFPYLQEPFGDVDTVPILLAPDAELMRRGVRLGVRRRRLTCSSNSVAIARAGGMGRPQLGLPCLRLKRTAAIGPSILCGKFLRRRICAMAWFARDQRGLIPSAICL